VWKFRNDIHNSDDCDEAWTAYNPADSVKVEEAYKDLRVAHLGKYIVSTQTMVQYLQSDLSKQRRVKRSIEPLDPPILNEDGVVEAFALRKRHRVEGGSFVQPEHNLSSRSTFPVPGHARLPTKDPPRVAKLAMDPQPAGIPPPVPPGYAPHFVRATGGRCVVVAPDTAMAASPTVINAIRGVLAHVPEVNRAPLRDAAVLMEPTRRWLLELGRPPDQKGCAITLQTPLAELHGSKKIPLSTSCTRTVALLQALATKALVTYVGERPNPFLLRNESMTPEQHLRTQMCVISGPVMILYDGSYSPLSVPPTVYVCSVPGINFAYSSVDVKNFTQLDSRHPMTPRLIPDKPKVLARMRLIWHHILQVMDVKHHVDYAVLCGIGCGAFKGKFGATIPMLWGKALAHVLCSSSTVLSHIRAVFIALPTFGYDDNVSGFVHGMNSVLHRRAQGHRFPFVVAVEDVSMVDTAIFLSKQSCSGGDTAARIGLLNPSDVQAMRHGWIGMYWDGGHIALEEVLAMQTTLLTHHVGLNPSLYSDESRMEKMEAIQPDM
jgi:hypothetical protein